ncbi:MAG: hypothetical protein U9P37_04035 [Pseudomonadota bacterium]|nr:hypothetical protein [Pseudomonadota bacterium]
MAIPKHISKQEAIKIQDKLIKKAPDLGETKEKPPKAERENLVSTRLYVPKDIKQRIAMAAVRLERFQYDIVVEAIEEWLNKNGM